MNNQIHPGGIPPRYLIPATFLESVVEFVVNNYLFSLLFFSGNCGAKFRKIFENQKTISLIQRHLLASPCMQPLGWLRPEGEQNTPQRFYIGE